MRKQKTTWDFVNLVMVVLVFFFLQFPEILVSQGRIDTLTLAREFNQKGASRKAFHLMKSYCKVHPDEFNSTWLYAKSSFLANRIGISRKLYEKTIRISPDNLYAQLDYADFLVNTGRYEHAFRFLTSYLNYDKDNYKALLLESKISYWQADYKEAIRKLNKIKSEDSSIPEVIDLRNKIIVAKATWLGINGGFFTDDQPLQCYSPSISAGLFLHPYASPFIKLLTPMFSEDGVLRTATWLQVGNQSVFSKQRMNLGISFGFINFPADNSFSWTASATLSKSFFYHLPVTISVYQSPYFSTVGSINSTIIEDRISLSAGWDRENSWYGQATFNLSYYPFDESNVYSGNGWIFSSPISFSVFKVRFGYGFAYNTSQNDHFISEKSVSQILPEYVPDYKIKGVYSPYFTPMNQQIHSGLLGIEIHPGKLIEINLNGNFGLIAMADIPYLFLDKDATGNFVIIKGYSYQRFNPIQVVAKASFVISQNINAEADYALNSTYYFIRNYAGLGLKIHFSDGQK
jgi:tetratricopeptide (TPR) repeat protein